ncbi:MAG TPA: PqqD family protein [Bryobacteraceae bacterium]|jgi:hypothetical protein
MPELCFRVNAPSVIYEKFDDELVAINLDTGVYHSLAGAAADAFELLTQEATQQEVSVALATKYAAAPDVIHSALTPFFEQLGKEGLIEPVEVRKQRGSLQLANSGSDVAFAPPTLDAYRDLQSLFLLDPVHDVGEEGWPEPKPGVPEA